MNKLSIIKVIILISILSFSAVGSLFALSKEEERTNSVLKITGPIYCKIAKLYVEGEEVKLVLKNPKKYNATFNPSNNYDPSGKYSFVGHNPSGGEISVEIGNSCTDLFIGSSSRLEKVIINVKGTDYEIGVNFNIAKGHWMLYIGGKIANSEIANKEEATAYLIGVEYAKKALAGAKSTEETRREQNALKFEALKVQQRSAEDARKRAEATAKIIEARKFAIQAQNAAEAAGALASQIPGNFDAEDALRKAKFAAKKAQEAVDKLKVKDSTTEKEKSEFAKKVQAVMAQLKVAEDALKGAQSAQTIVVAQKFATQAQNAANQAKKLALLVPGNAEAWQALRKAENAANRAQELVKKLKIEESSKNQNAKQDKGSAETKKKVDAVKAQQKIAENAQKAAATATVSVVAQRYATQAQNAVTQAKKLALLVAGNAEAEEAVQGAEEAAQKAQKAVEYLKSVEASKKEEAEIAKKAADTAKKVQAVKAQQKIAENAQKAAATATVSVVAQRYATQAQNAVTQAKKLALLVAGNPEAEEAVQGAEEAAQKAQKAVEYLKSAEASKKEEAEIAKKAVDTAKKVQAVIAQQKIAETALKNTKNSKNVAAAKRFVIQAQNAAKTARTLALQLEGNAEAEEVAQLAEIAAATAEAWDFSI